MALIIVQGDLLKSDCNIICHQANCQNTMGSGIALSIKQEFPEAYTADCRYYPRSPESKLGKVSYGISQSRGKIVANLYGQLNYWRPGMPKTNFTNYDALFNALHMLFDELILPIKRSGENPKVGVPYKLGSGRAGGDWDIVSNLLKGVSERYGNDIYAYQL